MFPPIYTTLQASASVRALLGARPRVYRQGEAPADVRRPYATWLVITGLPENTLSEPPAVDRDSIQIDIYAATDVESEEVGKAVRDQMETATYMTAWRVLPRDAETRSFRVSMDFDFFVDR